MLREKAGCRMCIVLYNWKNSKYKNNTILFLDVYKEYKNKHRTLR
jgi:hypothetical protein